MWGKLRWGAQFRNGERLLRCVKSMIWGILTEIFMRERSCHFSEALYGTVRVGDRGQIVIPVEARNDLGIKPGDKLMVVREPAIEGVVLVRMEALESLISHLTEIMERARITEERTHEERVQDELAEVRS